MAIELYDEKNIEQLPWPDNADARRAKNFLLPLVRENITDYIANTQTKLNLVVINHHIIPISVNNQEYESSYLTSNFFAINFLRHWMKAKTPFFSFIHQPIIWGLGAILKGLKINKTVIINNWLLTTNLYPSLSGSEIQEIVAFLSRRFPDHLLILRSLDAYNCRALIQSCEESYFRLICMRFVHIYDPSKKDQMTSKNRYHHRRDRKLINQFSGNIIGHDHIKIEDLPRLLDLFRAVYFKHTLYSPDYTVKFLKHVIDNKFLRIFCVRKDETIDGVFGYYQCNGVMTVPFIGYEIPNDMPMQYYRILTMLAIEEAEKENLVLNEGSGGSTHKQARGMKPFPEYTAIYDRHLPFFRRFFWGCSEKIIKWFVYPMIKRESVARNSGH